MHFVTIFSTDASGARSEDPLLAETLLQLLREQGVNARLLGTRRAALIGVAPHILQLRIEAPAAEAERAHELIEAFLTAHPATPRDPAMGEWGEPSERRRSPVVAGGASFILPGGSHFYAHRPATGLVLAGAIVVAFAVLVGGRPLASTCAALALAGLVACDLVAGQRAVRAWNRGERTALLRQLANGALLVLGSVCLALLVGPHLPTRTRPVTRFVHPLLQRR